MRSFCLVALLVVLSSPLAADASRRITARLDWETSFLGSTSSRNLSLGTQAPEGLKLPPAVAKPRFATVPFGPDATLRMLLDDVPESPRLWVDHDLDGELLDERRIYMKASGSFFVRDQGILLRDPKSGAVVEIPVRFMYNASSTNRLTWRIQAHRRGRVVVGGRLRAIALKDMDGDLRFDGPTDAVYIDLDGNGLFEITGDAPEKVTPGTPFRAGEEGFRLHTVDPTGAVVELEEVRPAPAARPRTWPTQRISAGPYTRAVSTKPFDTLKDTFEAEADKPYAARYTTVSQMGMHGTEEAGRFLVRVAAKDRDVNVRAAAVRALSAKNYLDLAGAKVLDLVGDGNQAVSGAAITTLAGMGHPKALDVAMDHLDSAHTAEASAAARVVASLAGPKARDLLVAAFRGASVPAVQSMLYSNGLRYVEGGPPREVMLEAAGSSYASLQAAGIDDLQKIGAPEARKLAMRLVDVRPINTLTGRTVARTLGAAGDPDAVEALLDLFDGSPMPANVSTEVLAALRSLRAPATVAVLVRALKHKRAEVRGMVAEILGGIPQEDVGKALHKQSKREKDPIVLAALLEALGEVGHPGASALLLKHASKRRSKDPIKEAVRAAAVRGLTRLGFGDKKARAFLDKLLKAGHWTSRVLALDAAKQLGDPNLVPRVAANLDHDTWQVRLAATEALGHLRVKACIPPLIARLAREEHARVKDGLAAALFRITGQPLYDGASAWNRWWDAEGDGFTVPDTIPEAIDTDLGGTGAGFYGIPITSERIIFVIDQSGSMSAPGRRRRRRGAPQPPRRRGRRSARRRASHEG